MKGGKEMKDTSIGRRIRDLREDADLKQKEVADALHITNRMLSNYERDICNPPIEYIVALSRYFHVSTDYLLSLTDDKTAYASFASETREDKRVLLLYHRLNSENQECIRGLMIALDRQEYLSKFLQAEQTQEPKEPRK